MPGSTSTQFPWGRPASRRFPVCHSRSPCAILALSERYSRAKTPRAETPVPERENRMTHERTVRAALTAPSTYSPLAEQPRAHEQEEAQPRPPLPASVVSLQPLHPPRERRDRGLGHDHLPAPQLGGIFTVRTSDQPSWRSCFSTSGRLRRSSRRRSTAMVTSR